METFADGVVICGDVDDDATWAAICSVGVQFPLVIADPPYGNIVHEDWDRINTSDREFCQWMLGWTEKIQSLSLPGAALYVWGGVGRPRDDKNPPFRPFLRYLVEVEWQTEYRLSTPITWKKKRAYGIQWGFLFCREELAFLILGDHKKPRKFTVPLLDVKRGYAGYSEKYPAHSEYLRRTNVWDDVTEIMAGKTHINQKPQRLMEIPIEIHTEPGEWVLDPFAGSGTTALAARKLGRRFVVVDKDPECFAKICTALSR